MATSPSITPLGPVQEENELDTDGGGTTRVIDTIRRPFFATRRRRTNPNPAPKEPDTLDPRQKTPPRTWLHRVAARFTISRGTRHTLKATLGGEKRASREGTEETSRPPGFRRKPIPSFAPPPPPPLSPLSPPPPPDACDARDGSDDVPSLSTSASEDEAATHASTHRSSVSIHTPRSRGAHTPDATKDQVWDFGEGEVCSGQSQHEPDTVSPPFVGDYDHGSVDSTYQVPGERPISHLCTIDLRLTHPT